MFGSVEELVVELKEAGISSERSDPAVKLAKDELHPSKSVKTRLKSSVFCIPIRRNNSVIGLGI
jgi:hypothetical protein